MSEKTDNISYALRWRPDFRYIDNKRIVIKTDLFKSTEPSITDKEAYRLTLASLRGQIAQGSGKIDVGSYSLKPGQEYDPDIDFSFLNRKDLSIVELDNYIKIMKRKLEISDVELNENIKEQLAKAESKKETLEQDTKNKNEEVKE